jgi:adenine deaminase
VPASQFESPRRPFTTGDLESLLNRKRVIGLAEMMNFPGVIAGAESELAKLAVARGYHVDGHAPGVLGRDLQAYAAAGIHSDHEAFTPEEGRQRLRAGMWLLIREASAARNLRALVPLVAEFGPSRMAFCTDDREPEHIAEDGHVNAIVRDAVAYGVAPEDALVMASHHPALWHGLGTFGAIAPGYQADLLLLPDLERFVPEIVLKRGRAVDEIAATPVPEWVRQSVRVKPVVPADFEIAWDGGPARVIGLVPGQIVTESLVEELVVAAADPDRDLAKIAVIERHLGTGRIGLGFVKGFGLQRGAVASTFSHDAHNLVVVGMSDEEMARAVARLVELGGGLVVVDGDDVAAELPLPVAGIVSDRSLGEVIDESDATVKAVHALGSRVESPFQSLAFLALSVIPSLKITDRGLVDVDRFELVPLTAETAAVPRLEESSL